MTASEFFRIARRPLWIGALLLALGLAAGFAALGQWQISRSIENSAPPPDDIDTETPVALDSIAEPATRVTEPQLGRMVTIEAELVPGDFTVHTDRLHDGTSGAWLVGHGVTPEGASVAIALGWAPDAAAAAAAEQDAPTGRRQWLGRYQLSESPHDSDFESGQRNAVSIAELVNLWADPGPVFAGYVAAAEPLTPGLDVIETAAPTRDVSLNWLNLFYALEWVVFAGFAIYLWYRLVKDVWEKEQAEAAVAKVED